LLHKENVFTLDYVNTLDHTSSGASWHCITRDIEEVLA